MGDVVLNVRVNVDKISWTCIVGMDSAELCHTKKHTLQLLILKEGLHVSLVCEVELVMRASHEVFETFFLKSAYQGGADKAEAAGNVYFRVDTQVYLPLISLNANQLFLQEYYLPSISPM